MPIEELGLLDDIDEIRDCYTASHGVAPVDLSHWDASGEFLDWLDARMELGWVGDFKAYTYSYDLPFLDTIASSFGYGPGSMGCLIAPSGTTAMHSVLRLLGHMGKRTIVALCPTYFPIFYASPWHGFEFRRCPLDWDGHKFRLPQSLESCLGPTTALWVTHPVYCTGEMLSASDGDRLARLSDTGVTIVTDECLCPAGRELGPAFNATEGHIGIFTPHKTILVNGAKFSAIVFPRPYQRFCDQWADVQFGGLPHSSLVAIRHYLSDNFLRLRHDVDARLEEARGALARIAGERPGLQVDPQTIGIFCSCYAPALPGFLGHDRSFLEQLTEQTAAILIPGARSSFPEACGFTFRINLGRCDRQAFAAFNRCCDYLVDCLRDPVLRRD